jgi:hypothetical protein
MKKWLFFLSLRMMVSFSFDSFSRAPAKINVYKRCGVFTIFCDFYSILETC